MTSWAKCRLPVTVPVKVALVLPSGTVTVAGTDARCGSELCSATAAPPAGAGPFRTTVPWNVLGPKIVSTPIVRSRSSSPLPPGGGGGGGCAGGRGAGGEPLLISKLRTADHAPSVRLSFEARTRHQ